MTGEEQGFLETWFKDYANGFRNGDGALHPMLELKFLHSLRVAENAGFIAANLKFSEGRKRLAEVCGLFHDIGRFNQFAEYGSFWDAETIDHGAEGRRVLEAQNMPSIDDPEDRAHFLYAVEYHNKNKSDISNRNIPLEQDMLLRLIRDADKLDIMEIVLNNIASDGFSSLPAMLPNIRLCRDISPEVLEEAQNTRSVSSNNLSTLADLLIMMATWFYDINYPAALQLASRRDILSCIQRELPETRTVRDIFTDIKNIIQNCRV